MGARTVFELQDNNGSVFLYSHWGGDDKIFDAANALAKSQPRWEDTTYGMRMFISQIIGNDWQSETGYGISAKNVFEEQYAPMIIDFETQVITFDESEQMLSFREFVNAYASVEEFARVII